MARGVFRRSPFWRAFPALLAAGVFTPHAPPSNPPASAVLKDATFSGHAMNGGGDPTATVSVTVANHSNRLLLVFFGTNGDASISVTTCTYGGNALTLVGSVSDGNGDQKLYCYRMIAPPVGTANLVVTTTSGAGAVLQVAAHVYYNVHQTTPLSTIQTMAQDNGGLVAAGCAGAVNGVAVGAMLSWWADTRNITTGDGTPVYVASGALSTATSQTSRTPAAPAGRHPGDMELATCASENNATHSWAGSGWVKLGQTNSGSGWTVSYGYRIYDGTNVDPVISWTGSADASARRHAYRDCHPSNAALLLGTVGAGTSSTHTSTGGNTTQNKSLAVYHDHCMANTALGAPAGWTEDVDSGSATGPCRTGGGHKNIATAGTGSGNISVAGGAAAWVQQQFELLCADNIQTAEVTDDWDDFSGASDTSLRTMSEPGAAFNAFTWNVAVADVFTAQATAVCVLPA